MPNDYINTNAVVHHKTQYIKMSKHTTLCHDIAICCMIFQADELAPVGNYDQRKQEEERRLENILERLNKLSLELSPPGPSAIARSVTCVCTKKKKRKIMQLGVIFNCLNVQTCFL